MGPQRYTVVEAPSAILSLMMCTLKGLYCSHSQYPPVTKKEKEKKRTANISSSCSLVTTSRSNFCFSLTTFLASVSSAG